MKNYIFTIVAVLAMSAPAFAVRGEGVNMSVIRHETANRTIKLVRIEGNLSCNLGAENNGQGCELKLQEAKTGRIFNLVEAANAMRLFQDGAKTVAIEGTLAGPETIQVRNASTL
jgi:hypothetical protein